MAHDRGSMRRASRDTKIDLWPAATVAVQNATGLDEYDAALRLAHVVNQLADLFDDEQDLFTPPVRKRATDESIDHLLAGDRYDYRISDGTGRGGLGAQRPNPRADAQAYGS